MKEAMKEVSVDILERDGKYRVDPPRAEAFIHYENGEVWARDAIVFRTEKVDALVVLPAEAVLDSHEVGIRQDSLGPESLLLNIPKGTSKLVEANQPGEYSYVVVCKKGRLFSSAVANSDPTIIIGRRG